MPKTKKGTNELIFSKLLHRKDTNTKRIAVHTKFKFSIFLFIYILPFNGKKSTNKIKIRNWKENFIKRNKIKKMENTWLEKRTMSI
jgi:hypothetical protein